MSADALVLHTLLNTCRQLRRLSKQPEVAKAALKREEAFASQLAKLTAQPECSTEARPGAVEGA